MRALRTIIYLLSAASWGIAHHAAAQSIDWQQFDATAFNKARQENKPVILDLGASWCHWCHVMDEKTYGNTTVINYLADHYITIRSNQDKRPDLYARYKDYGWPATIIFNSNGEELTKEAGYMEPDTFLTLLKRYNGNSKPAIRADHSPVTAQKGVWSPQIAQYIRNDFFEYLDKELGGYDMEQKFLDYDGIAFALTQRNTDPTLKKWLDRSIKASYQLNDPVWGGVCQYSSNYDWQHPHYEKILGIQARYIKIYSRYYLATGDTSARRHAQRIIAYLDTFFKSKNALYYNSQDADLIAGIHAGEYFALNDQQRRAQGIPRIDSACYTRENAQVAEAMVYYWAATGEQQYLDRAQQILQTIVQQYRQADSSYSHDLFPAGAPALADQLYLCQALLQHYNASGNTANLQIAKDIMQYILRHFKRPAGGYNSFAGNDPLLKAIPVLSENIDLCRLLNKLSYYGEPSFKIAAGNILAYIISPTVLKGIIAEPGILMAQTELRLPPKQNKMAIRTAWAQPADYFVVTWDK
ncbi:DUF255 domain-containing protein [Chitinophaga pendula]|uniref:DUF255 domain-containing protein n=1 Tax=Chitinophaga TaxID=79328 RepID=UPI000BAE8B6E|nr:MULTISPECIES: DUF255 domain-containing protein [Chitinophaga]ASZ12068.1 hypothetical protein CK934_14415 [Chitinophaga sp. MD30]UCJ04895.1 DUF255 domain-containing protein [Chitinophaga pendula]